MLKHIIILATCTIGSGSFAATITPMELTMTLESTGFTEVSIFDEDDILVGYYDYLDVVDDPWGITKHFDRFAVNQLVSLAVDFDDSDDQLNTCSIGGYSCAGSFGDLDGASFSFADGADSTAWGDFIMNGGTQIGDAVTLFTFEGGPTFESRAGDGYVMWNEYVHNFTVETSNLALPTVPLSSSVGFLAASLLGLGVLGRRAKPVI